ncbi:hypothetical protein CALCODRAFT_484165 [Calocera cornea HHB12733]|uniref:Zn(2)-C6 fungal-type domain-containing protein n=1 Tax=Calocera cornea HHB12733 TaxID=1353952 RepID=A0A165F422_9BASI|nr:hypothetical protein CALCODRAFT_484165 [Calocera cornea HHB12733]
MPPAQDIAHRNTSSTSERACDACRIRKLKCPSLLAHKTTGQACARCIKTGLLCVWEQAREA